MHIAFSVRLSVEALLVDDVVFYNGKGKTFDNKTSIKKKLSALGNYISV